MIRDNVYVDEISLDGLGEHLKANVCFGYFDVQSYYEQKPFLHPKELEYYNELKFERRKNSYLLGRYTAKKAISAYTEEENLQKISVLKGILNQPIATCPNNGNVQISITHCDDFGAAVAFPESIPMGIDVEKIEPEKKAVIESEVTCNEKKLIRNIPFDYCSSLTLLWTVKESISKVLKTGLMTPFSIYEINSIETKNNFVVCYFKNFWQYCTISFKVNNYMCSIAYPRHTEISINVNEINKLFYLDSEEMFKDEHYSA